MRVQKSVFECDLSESRLTEMKSLISEVMDSGLDSLRIYPLLAGSRAKQTILGSGIIASFPPAIVV